MALDVVLKTMAALLAIYAAVVLFAFLAQTSLLFPTSLAGGPRTLPHDAERITCHTPDGERLQGVRIPPAPDERVDRTVVLGFGGNAWNADDMALYLRELFPNVEVVTFHYRGYAPGTGRPSAAALLGDAPVVYDCITRGHTIAMNVIVVGFSIGSGVAARLARQRPVDGLILVTPFDTLVGLAREHYGWLPVGLLLRHHMYPVEELREISAPVALIAAERDTIIPGQRTAPLREVARDLVVDRTITGAGHNEIYQDPVFAQAMHEAMKVIQDRAQEK